MTVCAGGNVFVFAGLFIEEQSLEYDDLTRLEDPAGAGIDDELFGVTIREEIIDRIFVRAHELHGLRLRCSGVETAFRIEISAGSEEDGHQSCEENVDKVFHIVCVFIGLISFRAGTGRLPE